ncbi:MAG: dihydrolipoyl dehydrogenase, partial [Lachnospiraceae bacterium]|nr:dihydrolipoyl dehydrogenase [Lachnospiraceae bacterium]
IAGDYNMAKEVFMPKSGMDMQEGTIIRWLADVGDQVRQGEPLLEIETDKVSMEIEAPASGILLCKYFDEGAVVPVVTIIGYIGEKGEAVPEKPSMAGGSDREDEQAAMRSSGEKSGPEYDYRVAVIGGGPAGYVAALRAARFGEKTVLFEKDEIGGTCTNRGCVPMKSYMHAVRMLDNIEKAAENGFLSGFSFGGIDFEALFNRKESTVELLRERITGLLKRSGVEIVREEAMMIGRHHIRAGKKTYRAENTIIAAGALAKELDVPGADHPCVIDASGMLSQREVPDELVIIGGGVIGCEIAAAWNRFGSYVTIIEQQDHLIPTFDEDVSREIEKVLRRRGIEIKTGSRIDHIFDRNGKPVLVTGDNEELEADRLLVSVGRRPDLTCLGVLADKIDYERGKIMVDEYCRTSLDNIYACGDITNRSILAHSAMKMGEAAASCACGRPKEVRLNRAPLLLFTIPEAAGIGMTEMQARKQGDILVGRFPFSANGRAVAFGETEGFVKVIADKGYGEILGVHIVGTNATELIVEAKTMMDMEITVYEVADIMHPHPTWSEAFMEACADAIGECLHLPAKG